MTKPASVTKPTLAQLKLFLGVVKAGSVGGAARKMGLTQSGVSHAVMALERSLGLPLLVRGPSGAVPTAFAASMLSDIETATIAVERIEHRARQHRLGAVTPLRIAAIASVADSDLVTWIRRFQQRYPNTILSIVKGDHIDIGGWVARGVADIGFTGMTPAGLTVRLLREEELLLAAHRAHPLIGRAKIGFADLASATLIVPGYGCDLILEPFFSAAGERRPMVIRATDIQHALEMVQSRQGVTVLPASVFPRRDMPDLRIRHFSPPAHRQLYTCARENDPRSAAAAGVFLRIVRTIETGPPH
jgi:DNA-binding transcriptional LysR family regulator